MHVTTNVRTCVHVSMYVFSNVHMSINNENLLHTFCSFSSILFLIDLEKPLSATILDPLIFISLWYSATSSLSFIF